MATKTNTAFPATNSVSASESKPLLHEDRILFGDTLAIYHATNPDSAPVATAPVAEPEPAVEIAPPPKPKKKKATPAKSAASEPPAPSEAEATAVPGSGCLGLLLAAAIPAIGYLILR